MKLDCKKIEEFWSIILTTIWDVLKEHWRQILRCITQSLRNFFCPLSGKFSKVSIKFWDVFEALCGEKF